MKLTQCDICETNIPSSEINSSIQNRVKNVLREMSDYDDAASVNLDVCTECACSLKDSFDEAVESWKKNKGVYA